MCHRLEEAKKKITKCDEILDRILEKKENPSGETDEIQIRSVVNSHVLVFIIVL